MSRYKSTDQRPDRVDPVDRETALAVAREIVRRTDSDDEARLLMRMLGLDNAPMRTADTHREWPEGSDRPDSPVPAPKTDPWWERAACKGDDLAEWFPVGKDEPARYARSVCRDLCPVREDCIRYALTTPRITDGIWGGYRMDIGAERNQVRKDYGHTVAARRLTEPPPKDPGDAYVPVTLAVHRVLTGLVEAGLSYQQIADLVGGGATRAVVCDIVRGRTRAAKSRLIEAILAVESSAVGS